MAGGLPAREVPLTPVVRNLRRRWSGYNALSRGVEVLAPLPRKLSVTAPLPVPDFSRSGGLVVAIAQDAETGQVLMVAWMNQQAYEETLRTGQAVYYSRSRGKLWRKGEESGHVQRVREVYVDCDADAVLLQVEQTGAACHEGFKSCFFRRVTPQGPVVVAQRVVDPQTVYRGPGSDRAD